MTYITVDVPRDTKSSPGLFLPKDKLTIFRTKDIATYPTRDSKGIYIAGNIVMKSNKNMLILYVTPGTTKFEGTGEGDADAMGILQKISASHPGYALAIAEFLANNKNENLGSVLEFCDGGTPLLFGSECAPLKLTPNVNGGDGKIKSEFELASINVGPDIAHYGGTITLATDNNIAADDATPSVSSGTGRYVIPNTNTIATTITAFDDAVKGMVITLVGSGGANLSTINTGGEFILEGGASWSSNDGSTITFEVFAANVFIERSRD